MVEYRKKIELDRDKDYWFVEMGQLNFLNGGSSYPFPSLSAARKFAEDQKHIAKAVHGIDREVRLLHPDGTVDEF